MNRFRKKNITILLLVMLLLLTVGYAALSTTLKINGTIDVSKASWDVHFENVNITPGSVTATQAPTTNNTNTTEMNYTINFTKPGDFYEFTTDIVNDGTIDAMIDVVDNNAYATVASTTPIALPSYLTSSTTYDDGVLIQQNQMITHETSEKIKVRIEFKKDISASDLPSSGDTTVVFKLKGQYKQADEDAKPIRIDFATEPWDNILDAYTNNPKSLEQSMKNGTTREVQLDMDYNGTPETTSHLRIANLSTPPECNTAGFSQTACGFVIEFTDVITKHRMNPSGVNTVNGQWSKGGWEYSDMRAYLNGKVYLKNEPTEIDYTSIGIYDALPSYLKNTIIDTTVVSGHGLTDSANFTTTDKLYLFSNHEIWEGVEGHTHSDRDYFDSAYHNTRQLDYYKEKGLTVSNCASGGVGTAAAKNYLPTGVHIEWWLRTANSNGSGSFNTVLCCSTSYSCYDDTRGVSPAFRIAKQN